MFLPPQMKKKGTYYLMHYGLLAFYDLVIILRLINVLLMGQFKITIRLL